MLPRSTGRWRDCCRAYIRCVYLSEREDGVPFFFVYLFPSRFVYSAIRSQLCWPGRGHKRLPDLSPALEFCRACGSATTTPHVALPANLVVCFCRILMNSRSLARFPIRSVTDAAIEPSEGRYSLLADHNKPLATSCWKKPCLLFAACVGTVESRDPTDRRPSQSGCCKVRTTVCCVVCLIRFFFRFVFLLCLVCVDRLSYVHYCHAQCFDRQVVTAATSFQERA